MQGRLHSLLRQPWYKELEIMKTQYFLYKDILIVIISQNAFIFKWSYFFCFMRNCTLKQNVILLWFVCSAQTWYTLEQWKSSCASIIFISGGQLGGTEICSADLGFFSFFFFFFWLLCLHRKLWIGIFVSFYSKFLLSHPPNLEPETAILPHPNSARRPFEISLMTQG